MAMVCVCSCIGSAVHGDGVRVQSPFLYLGREIQSGRSSRWRKTRTHPWSSVRADLGQAAARDLEGEHVVVVGLGVSGRAAARLAGLRGARVTGVDARETVAPLELDPSIGGAGTPSGADGSVRTELGPHRRETFLRASRLVLSPGVPLTQPDVAAAIAAGIPVSSELSFAAEVMPSSTKMAAVTGTNGKSTVTTFAGQLLKAAGVNAFVGGNLGDPLSTVAAAWLQSGTAYEAAVVEVSSYQLELVGGFHPKAALIINLTPDHLARHKTLDQYAAAKCRVFENMGPEDVAILPWGDERLSRIAAEAGNKGTRAWLGVLPGVQLDPAFEICRYKVPGTAAEGTLDLRALTVLGLHNRENAGTAALLAASLDLGISESQLQAALPSLSPPPHRMQVVCEDSSGILWIDDSKATNVEAALVGLRGLRGGTRRAVVLLGGEAKEDPNGGPLGFAQLVEALAQHRAVVAFGASGEAIARELTGAELAVPLETVATMRQAVGAARELARPGDCILLSPACASFDEFNNYVHRGQVFAELAQKMMQ